MEGLGALVFVAILALVAIVPLVLWLWSLIHCVTNERLSDTNRLIGILLIVFLFLLGSFVYLFLPREPLQPRDQRYA
ncbi:MAG: hypothetical protein HKN82_18670 [Akkermansiaceae bacterium]|nr:hypothetical protein [Akkermansiaceae bacterium]NNM28776.1 hypothetical protein [Akkermansiaceae bacterium]